ncbi:hypothetical protein COSO111634_38320 [Corallococcus soli]
MVDEAHRPVVRARVHHHAPGGELPRRHHLPPHRRHRRGHRRRVRLTRRTRGPRVLHAARRAHREAQPLQHRQRERAAEVLHEDLMEQVQHVIRQRRPGQRGLGVLHVRVEDGDALEHPSHRVQPGALRLRAMDAALRPHAQQRLHHGDGEGIPITVHRRRSRRRQRLGLRVQPQRVQELLREHRADVAAELEAVRVDEVRVRPHHQHVQVVEVPHHHAACVQPRQHPVKPRQHRHRVRRPASRAPERRLSPPAQRLRAVQLAHRIAPHLRALAVRGQRLRRHHPRRQPRGKGAQLALVLREPGLRGVLFVRQAQVVRMLGPLEDLERPSVAQVIHIRLAALAQRALRIQPQLLAFQPEVHGLTPSPSADAAPPAWCHPTADPACAAAAAP